MASLVRTGDTLDLFPALVNALRPFAKFMERWEQNPLGNQGDILYAIHAGDRGAEIRLSHMKLAKKLVEKADKLWPK